MKPYQAVPALTLLIGALACAQEIAGDRVVVPARNNGQPRKVNAWLTNGSITVRTHPGADVIVETEEHNRGRRDQRADGLRRLNIPARGLSVEEANNVITVRLPASENGSLLITVPANTSLELKSTNGAIDVDGAHGDIVASSSNGAIHLNHVSGTVVADSHNGAVTVTMDAVDPGKPISFSSWNGNIDVTLPADLRANLKLRSSENGDVWTDFDVRLAPGQIVTEPSNTRNGRPLRVRTDRTVTGTVNGGGGIDASFTTWNGSIYIRKKK